MTGLIEVLLQQPNETFHFGFLATKFVGKCSPYVSPFLLGTEVSKDVLLFMPLYQFHTLSEYPWWLWMLCYADLYYTNKSQLSLSNLIFIQFFRLWHESFLIWRFSDREEELCYISDTIVIWVIVNTAGLRFVSIKRCRKVLQKKLSKYSRSSGCSFCQIIVFVLQRTNTTVFDHNDFLKCNESRF